MTITAATPTAADISAMARSILSRQMEEGPDDTVVSSGIILPTIADYGFPHDYEIVVEDAVEDVWGRYLRGEIADLVAAVV